MKGTLDILVFPGGTEIGLEINRALGHCKEIRLYSAGTANSNHAPYVFSRHFILAEVHDHRWIQQLNALVAENEIDYIFPAHDDVLTALAEHGTEINTKVVSSPQETCLITRSKSRTYSLLSGILPVPIVYSNPDNVDKYPVFVKPDKGQGSQQTYVAETPQDLSCLLRVRGDFLVCEYLPGDEYTIDCFSDREAGLLFVGGRQRIRTRNGIAVNSKPVVNDLFAEYAKIISGVLELHGAWFFQLKRDRKGLLKLLEIAPRIAGTMALHRALGINFPLLSIYEQERIPIQIMKNDYEIEVDRALTNRYTHNLDYSAVYVDLDDTLLLNGNVNVEVIRFIYQSLNAGKRIVLLTRHIMDVSQTLQKYRLNGLFDEVVHIGRRACKADYIRESSAILIDDSFRERKVVWEKTGIATFDCTMLEMLVDERR